MHSFVENARWNVFLTVKGLEREGSREEKEELKEGRNAVIWEPG